MQPINRGGKVHNHHELNDNILSRDMQNKQFKAHGMSNRVDLPHLITQESVSPVRMCSIFNEDAARNEERIEAEICHLNSESTRVLEKVTKHMRVFMY